MKSFELSQKVSKNGRRHFKVILHEIYPDSCVDESTGIATQYNENGISWIREYCEKALDSIHGMSLKASFLDDERTLLCGHGETGCKDDLPLFEDATVIGYFENGYIEDVETPDGVKTFCIGEGILDGLCYKNFAESLEKDIENGEPPHGSVEILKTGDNPGIVYKYGFKDFGRIPMVFEYSGYALIGVRPADPTAKILELNNKEEIDKMDKDTIKAIVSEVVDELSSFDAQIEQVKAECESKMAEVNAIVAEKEVTIGELTQTIEALKADLANALAERDGLLAEKEAMTTKVAELETAVEEANKEKKIGELNAAIDCFSEAQKAYAKEEIEAFMANPITSEINTVVGKIHEEIGKRAFAESQRKSEKDDDINIFSEVFEKVKTEEVDIFN